MKHIIVAAGLALLAAMPGAAAREIEKHFVSGADLLAKCPHNGPDFSLENLECFSYIEGAIDMLAFLRNVNGRPDCITTPTSAGIISDTVLERVRREEALRPGTASSTPGRVLYRPHYARCMAVPMR
jgi:hypothetical protein